MSDDTMRIETNGGAVIQGDVHVEQGDFIGRDQIIGYTAEEVAALIDKVRQADQPTAWDGRYPYVGLAAFQEADAQFFFGRERVVRELVARVGTSRFVCIAGPSGSGKSSLAQAGLLYQLRQGALDGSEKWLFGALTPQGNPIEQLAMAMARLAKSPIAGEYVRDKGRHDATALHNQIETLLSPDSRQRCVLLIDQFEEAFTQTKDESVRCALVNLLTTAAQIEAGRTIIVLAMRSDFVTQCASYPDLRTLMSQQFQLVGAMEPRELALAITRPALEVGATIDPELVSRVIADMKNEPGALPLMQFALKDLFDSQSPQRDKQVSLTLKDYLSRGGIDQALERHADTVFDRLTAEQQGLARSIFTRLIEVGRGTTDTRRTVAFSQLVTATSEPSHVADVVTALADARLVTTSAPVLAQEWTEVQQIESTGELAHRNVTVAHEKLIDAWPWLRKLVNENREAIALQNQISEDAQAWEENARDPDFLYIGTRLAHAEELIDDMGILLDERSQSFIDGGIQRRQREKEERERAQQEEQDAQRKRTRVLTSLLTALLIFLIPTLFVTANIWMFYRRQNSDWQYTGFTSNSVLSIATSGQAVDTSIPRICVGTADIGVGCSYDLQNWNVYQVGFPTGPPATFNNRDSWLGSLTGSAWSTTIHGIEVIAFDVVDPTRIYVSVMNRSGLYVSSDSGVNWKPVVADASLARPELPTDVRRIAAYDGDMFVLRQSEALSSVEPQQRGSLHLSQDNGFTWQQIGGSSTPTGVVRDFFLMLDSEGKLDSIYGAGETGLWRSDVNGEWEWQRLLAIDDGSISVLVKASDQVVYLATYDFENKGGAVYRWTQNESDLTGKWVEFSGAPRSMVLDPNLGSEFPLWLLFEDGKVAAVHRSGRLESRGRRPGWPWSTAKSLGVFQNAEGDTLVLMGHRDGLLQFCPTEQRADGCRSAE